MKLNITVDASDLVTDDGYVVREVKDEIVSQIASSVSRGVNINDLVGEIVAKVIDKLRPDLVTHIAGRVESRLEDKTILREIMRESFATLAKISVITDEPIVTAEQEPVSVEKTIARAKVLLNAIPRQCQYCEDCKDGKCHAWGDCNPEKVNPVGSCKRWKRMRV